MELNDWQSKYIEIRADISRHYTDVQCAKMLGVSAQSICNWKRAHPEVEELIGRKLERQMNQIRNKAMQALFERIDKSDRALQIALEISGVYTPKSEQTTTVKAMDSDAKKRHIKMLVNSLINNKQDVDDAGSIGAPPPDPGPEDAK